MKTFASRALSPACCVAGWTTEYSTASNFGRISQSSADCSAWTVAADCWILGYKEEAGTVWGRVAWVRTAKQRFVDLSAMRPVNDMGPNIYLAAVACFILAAACSAVGVTIRQKQRGQPARNARLNAARFRFAMLSGAVFSLSGAALMFSTLP